MAQQAVHPIIVVGGSSRHLRDAAAFQQACQALGQEIVRAGFKVRAGSLSESTADYWIAKAAYQAAPTSVEFYRPTNDETETDNRREEFTSASFIKGAEKWQETYPMMIDGAHGLLIIGGASHTRMLWDAAARRENFPRVAIPAFQGTAQDCFKRYQPTYQQLVHTADRDADLTRWNTNSSARIWLSILQRLVAAPQTPIDVSASSVVDLQGAVQGAAQASGAAAISPPQRPVPEAPTGIAVTLEDKPPPADLLDRKPLAEALAAMFAYPDQPTPLTVAILGDWGAGKTTLMEMTKQEMAGNRYGRVRFRHAHFSAWHYEHVPNTFAGLANEVVIGLSHGQNLLQRLTVLWRFGLAEHGWKILWVLVQLAFGIVCARFALVWGWDAVAKQVTTENAVAKAILSTATGAGAIYFFVTLFQQFRTLLGNPLADKLATYFRLPEYGEHLGLVPVLQRQLKILCKIALGDTKRTRLLVVIEDLDRCGAKCINETFDAVRLIMDLPGVIVVLLMDHRIAFKALEQRFAPLADDIRPSKVISRDFLGKIIQLPIVLAPPATLKRFVRERLFALPDDAAPEPVPQRSQSEVLTQAATPSPQVEERDEKLSQTIPWQHRIRAFLWPASNEPSVSDAVVNAMSHSLDEAREFERLASLFHLENPRRLTRLRNSYRLAKLLVYQRISKGGQKVNFSWERTMQTLFWREYLAEASPEERRTALKADSQLIKDVPPIECDAREQMVQFLVLPHSS